MGLLFWHQHHFCILMISRVTCALFIIVTKHMRTSTQNKTVHAEEERRRRMPPFHLKKSSFYFQTGKANLEIS